MSFTNKPNLQNEERKNTVKRYVHQPLTVEHYGIHATIKENGKIKIQSAPQVIKGTDEVEYDEVEIPASLIFKLATLLKATRTIKYVTVTEGETLPKEEE